MSISSVRRSVVNQGGRLLKIHEAELHNLGRRMKETVGQKHERQWEQYKRLVEKLIPRDKALVLQEARGEEC